MSVFISQLRQTKDALEKDRKKRQLNKSEKSVKQTENRREKDYETASKIKINAEKICCAINCLSFMIDFACLAIYISLNWCLSCDFSRSRLKSFPTAQLSSNSTFFPSFRSDKRSSDIRNWKCDNSSLALHKTVECL